MVKRIGGIGRKTRGKLRKHPDNKGKISITRYFQTFEKDVKVQLVLEPAANVGKYHPRFYGRVGKIIGKTGNCYKVEIKDINKSKIIIAHPIHLKKI